jgi:hypothetical protein
VDLAIVDVTRRFYKQEEKNGNEWFRANKKINNNYHESIWLSGHKYNERKGLSADIHQLNVHIE